MKQQATKLYLKGVTLLEILLVLALAAMILILSIRYYQSAKSGQDQGELMSMITAITAAADSYSVGTNGYAGMTFGSLSSLLPPNVQAAKDPWGGSISITGAGASSYNITFSGVPASVCSLVKSRLASNTHYTAISCGSGLGYTYQYAA